VRAVASNRQIPATWLNDVVGDALRNNGTVPEGTVWRTLGMLEIYIPPKDYMLALKLLAGRPRDVADIQALSTQLAITSREQAQQVVDTYVPDRSLQQLNHVDLTLDRLFPSRDNDMVANRRIYTMAQAYHDISLGELPSRARSNSSPSAHSRR
jgi:hypothetical protein